MTILTLQGRKKDIFISIVKSVDMIGLIDRYDYVCWILP